MDMMVDIFKQLGANESLMYQFGIVVVMYFLTKFLFLDHLQKVLDTREDKTVNLEGNAEKQFAEIDKLQKEYKEKMLTVNKSLKEKADKSKNEIIKTHEKKYRSEEEQVNSFIEKSRKEIESEIEEKKDKIMQEAEQLASNLVQRMTKG